MKIDISSCTYTGRAYKKNDNNHFMDEKLGLYIVCDGRGENGKGQIATQMVIDFIHQSLASQKKIIQAFADNPTEAKSDSICEMIETAIHKSSYQIHKAISMDPNRQKMGTSIVMALVIGDTLFCAHVGNGRIYLSRDQELHLLTYSNKQKKIEKDSSAFVLETPGESGLHIALSNALGSSGAIKIELLSIELTHGDTFLLCTNGVYDSLSDDKIKTSLLENKGFDQASALINHLKKIKEKESATVISLSTPTTEVRDTQKISPQDKFAALKEIPLFSLLDYKELAKVLSNMKNKRFLKDEEIVKMGEKGSEFYVILSGSAEVLIKSQLIAKLAKGDYFGELSLIDKFPRSATVKATSNLDALVMDKEHFYKIINNERTISIKLLWRFTKTLTSHLRKTDALISELGIDKNTPFEHEEIVFEFE